MAVAVKKDYQRALEEQKTEVRNLVVAGLEQIKEGKPITITEPSMTRFIMSLDEAEDLFGIQVYQDALIEYIRLTDTPITIALQGEWGSGKTSLMNLLRYNLCEIDDAPYYPVWINTWQYSLMKMRWIWRLPTVKQQMKLPMKSSGASLQMRLICSLANPDILRLLCGCRKKWIIPPTTGAKPFPQ